MFFVENNGVRLHCASMGSGPTLVLCHGLVFGSMASWYFSIATKLAQHYLVILFDLRGHGKSDVTATGYDLATMAGDLNAVINHAVPSGESVTLIGHSFGALLALRYTLDTPRKVNRLVLVDAPLPASRYILPSIADTTSLEMLLEQLPTPRSQVTNGVRRANRMRERLQYLLLHSSLRADVAAMGDIDDIELRRLGIPVLCVYGRLSDCTAAGERLVMQLPLAQLHWLNCGHYILEEAPQELLRVLTSFLEPDERKDIVALATSFFAEPLLREHLLGEHLLDEPLLECGNGYQ